MKIHTKSMLNTRTPAALSRQQGAVLVLYTIGMLIILAMAGLALDVPHAMLNKSRLQNTVDSAALAAAEVLNDGGDQAAATAMAKSIFTSNAGAAGNGEMGTAVSVGDVTVEYSPTLEPFDSDSTEPARYVRVSVSRFNMAPWLIQLIGRGNSKNVRASAVSGPSPSIGAACDLVPLLICGDTSAGGPLWGYNDNDVTVLKSGSESGGQDGPIGPGNFQLARLGGSGSDVVRNNLAGGYEECQAIGSTVPTEPGNSVGPVAQGINTRLGLYNGPIRPDDYPPDVVTEQQINELVYDEATGNITQNNVVVTDSTMIDFNYQDYQARIAAPPATYDNPPPVGAYERRNLSVIIVDCDGANSGQTDMPILGFACYFMLQEVKQQGNKAEMYGEFVEECEAEGNAGPLPTTEPGPTRIVLYKDVDSRDS